MSGKSTEAQKRASKKWRDANKERQKWYDLKSKAKKFVRECSSDEFQEILEERKEAQNER